MRAPIRLGTQGWNYDAWLGAFYPLGTRQPQFLGVYSRAFATVEVDSTFYAIPAAKTVRGWASRVPDGFTFALKLPQEITHERRLRGAEPLLEEFTDRARELGNKLGPILIQLGPDFGPAERAALVDFLPALPADLRFAIEFRQEEWISDDLLPLLTAHKVALALSDGRWIERAKLLSVADQPTADFVYVRWMGPDRSIVDFSRTQVDRFRELEAWADVLVRLAERGIEVFGYVNNHFAGHSPSSTRDLQRLLGQDPVEPEQLGEQMTFF